MMNPFTEASNLPLSPLVALLATGTMSPGHLKDVFIKPTAEFYNVADVNECT